MRQHSHPALLPRTERTAIVASVSDVARTGKLAGCWICRETAPSQGAAATRDRAAPSLRRQSLRSWRYRRRRPPPPPPTSAVMCLLRNCWYSILSSRSRSRSSPRRWERLTVPLSTRSLCSCESCASRFPPLPPLPARTAACCHRPPWRGTPPRIARFGAGPCSRSRCSAYPSCGPSAPRTRRIQWSRGRHEGGKMKECMVQPLP